MSIADAMTLVEHTSTQLDEIEETYRRGLKSQTLPPNLPVMVKNALENLRSALDYSAVALYDAFGTGGSCRKVYFPYSREGDTRAQFRDRLDTAIPGLRPARPDLAKKLERRQAFESESYSWLPVLADLTNENKHRRLSPQKRVEHRRRRIESGGAGIILSGGASISMGPGTSITMGDAVIPGGQTFSADKPATVFGRSHQAAERIVGWTFADTDVVVLPFLKAALAGTQGIVAAIADWLPSS